MVSQEEIIHRITFAFKCLEFQNVFDGDLKFKIKTAMTGIQFHKMYLGLKEVGLKYEVVCDIITVSFIDEEKCFIE